MLISPSRIKIHAEMNNIEMKGVLHIGAHRCEEISTYKKWNVISVLWIEANPNICADNKANGIENCYCAVIDEIERDVDFNLSDVSMCSSLLEPGTHITNYPLIKFSRTLKVRTQTLPGFFEMNNISPTGYNIWNLDIQGSELYALRGAKDLLGNVDIIYCEVNIEEVYKGCGLLKDIDSLLSDYDFKRVELELTKHGWGEALYVKNQNRGSSV